MSQTQIAIRRNFTRIDKTFNCKVGRVYAMPFFTKGRITDSADGKAPLNVHTASTERGRSVFETRNQTRH